MIIKQILFEVYLDGVLPMSHWEMQANVMCKQNHPAVLVTIPASVVVSSTCVEDWR